ncbi:MAG: MAPEG family protein [Ruegeria sp.]
MLPWIVAAIVLYLVGLFVPALIVVRMEGIGYAFGPRDTPPGANILLGRARRAHENFKEGLGVFLALGILNMLPETGPAVPAVNGAMLFVLGRALYIPLYLSGIKYIRSLAFAVSLFGIILMLLALL